MTNPRFHRTLLTLTTVRITISFLLAALFIPPNLSAQQVPAQQTSLQELVRAAIQNELKDDSRLHLFSWKERKHKGRDTQIEELVSTPSGIFSRVLLINGKPLDPAQQRLEDQRRNNMFDSDQIQRKQKDQKADDERTEKMLATIPDAFTFTYLDTVTAPNGHKLVRIKFTSNPSFNPPSRESVVFTGMQGEMLVDETAQRLAKIDGTLFKDVNFGWGILGKLYKGGRFVVEQAEVTPAHWETTRMVLHFDGKVLMLKPLHIDDNETFWDFQPVPPMSVEQARDFLARSQVDRNAMLAP
jgi:hypothetical protein